MNSRLLAATFLFVYTTITSAQTPAFAPFSDWRSPFVKWDANRANYESANRSLSPKPVLPGLRLESIELLQESLTRKFPNHFAKHHGQERRVIGDKYFGKGSDKSRINGRNTLNGVMAEALFLRKNPQWNYVSKSNATQHDVWRPSFDRRPPINGQVKFHSNGSPATYAMDMIKDYRAHRFFVPDDHVDNLRSYLKRNYELAKLKGDLVKTKKLARDIGRVQPLGCTSKEICVATKQSAQFNVAERNASYVSLGAAVSLSIGQIGWDYAHGSISADQATYRVAKAVSLMGTGLLANQALSFVKNGAFRGTLKGNLLVGAVILLVETSWNIAEHGGWNAFQNAGFYEQLGGSVSALAVGSTAAFYAGTTATMVFSETGPAAPFIGAATAFVVGSGVGMVAYLGGRSASSAIIRNFFPELYQQQVRSEIAAAKSRIENRIREATTTH